MVSDKVLESCVENNVQLGHSTKRLNSRNLKYILIEKSGHDIIDPNVTIEKLKDACEKLRDIVAARGKVLFVCTKDIAKGYIRRVATELDMPFVTERWLAGMLTNFFVVKKMMKKNDSLNEICNSPRYSFLSKKEQSILRREIEKKNLLFDGINKKMYRTPAALVVVDVFKEKIAVKEASRISVPVFGLVDTNVSFEGVSNPIPCNDDSLRSIIFVVEQLKKSITEGLAIAKKDDSSENDVSVK